jgi:2-polyprenyl-3-methyl-5-hydroxy-6-metoxy-1,4-benzoquinol methylase
VRALRSCGWNSRSLLPAPGSIKDITMADSTHYVIRGGLEGRERLRVLGRVMRTSSMLLFDRLGLRDGITCLDVGCGGGDATLELAHRVAPAGRVVGVDIDETKLQIARAEASRPRSSPMAWLLNSR